MIICTIVTALGPSYLTQGRDSQSHIFSELKGRLKIHKARFHIQSNDKLSAAEYSVWL